MPGFLKVVRRRAALAALVALPGTTLGSPTASARRFPPIHPPAVPLATRAPYVNTWLQGSDVATGTTSKFWLGNANNNFCSPKTGNPYSVKGITGIARIDGQAYLFFGKTPNLSRTMRQTSAMTTPTQSVFTFEGGGVVLTVDFLSPVEAQDLKRLSMPLTDIVVTAHGQDKTPHTVSVYVDIGGEWADSDPTANIGWTQETVALNSDGSQTSGNLAAWTVSPASPTTFNEFNCYPTWGTALWATGATNGVTLQSGTSLAVRGQFVSNGTLTGANDTNQPRPAQPNADGSDSPVFAFAKSLGTVTSGETAPFTLLLGHERDPALNYLGTGVHSLWTTYFSTPEAMLAFAYNDSAAAVGRADALDAKIESDATAVGGERYAALLALSLRQTFAATELMTSPVAGEPYLFLEEISSDNDTSSTDVIYPAMPAFLYLNPELVRYLIDPILYYAESKQWPETYAPHDLNRWPNAVGHNDGGGELMPVEATAGMLILADAYMQRVPKAEAQAFALQHYAILSQWAAFLAAVPSGATYSNAVDPPCQLITTDAFGEIAHDTNLALKGIIGLGAMGQIAAIAGNTTDANTYAAAAAQGIATWARLAQSNEKSHLLLQYRESGPTSGPQLCQSTLDEPDHTFSLKYNAFADKLLGLNLIPTSVLAEESSFYRRRQRPLGTFLQTGTIKFTDGNEGRVTTTFWETWTAAGMGNPDLESTLIDEVHRFAGTTRAGRPFPDRYDPSDPQNVDFEARPVVGGLFAPLLTPR